MEWRLGDWLLKLSFVKSENQRKTLSENCERKMLPLIFLPRRWIQNKIYRYLHNIYVYALGHFCSVHLGFCQSVFFLFRISSSLKLPLHEVNENNFKSIQFWSRKWSVGIKIKYLPSIWSNMKSKKIMPT